MELMNLLLKRRSVRNYTGDAVPREKLEAILEAGLSSASGRNRKPWELIVVSDRDILEKLSHCRTGAARMLEKAGCAILVFADPEKTDVWTEDCSIVMSNMHLMAASLGLGSCWIQGRLRFAENGESTEGFCRRLLGVPEEYALEAILSVGIPAAVPEPHKPEELEKDKVHWESWKSKTPQQATGHQTCSAAELRGI